MDIPTDMEGFLRLCQAQDFFMNYKGLENTARKGIGKIPYSFVAYAYLGYALEWQKRDLEAKDAYSEARHLIDQNIDLKHESPQLQIGIKARFSGENGLYAFTNNDAEAQIVGFRKKVRDEPGEWTAWFMLGSAEYERDNIPVVTACYYHLKQLNPERAKVFETAYIVPIKKRGEQLYKNLRNSQ